ncbi:hypothetical protein BKA93DRAFT_808649 [Sparassis latifolia]|uniref:PPPDE domain-containing protein n=1 Tax=Sparassis crispa TaxID=139825 RepID=A0A401G870_9APHY|nr:hypothetical protein SCP_0112650 [Sparassis crispa]GBE78380.1 hypothetical protein SCP_0112650 [Sparassis crispa]
MTSSLQVTQVWRGTDSEGNILPLHWALVVPTSGPDSDPVGNLYNAAGNIDTFHYEELTNVSLKNINWRGSLVVCNFPTDALHVVESILRRTPVVRHDYGWNCQNWVWACLRQLRRSGFDVRPKITWEGLRAEMFKLLEAWEAGDI